MISIMHDDVRDIHTLDGMIHKVFDEKLSAVKDPMSFCKILIQQNGYIDSTSTFLQNNSVMDYLTAASKFATITSTKFTCLACLNRHYEIIDEHEKRYVCTECATFETPYEPTTTGPFRNVHVSGGFLTTNFSRYHQKKKNVYYPIKYFRECFAAFLTKKKLTLSDDIQEDIIEDFQTLFQTYQQSHNQQRKNFLNSKYVMYQLLNRHGYKMTDRPIKCSKSMKWHDEVTKELFKDLGWEHFPST